MSLVTYLPRLTFGTSSVFKEKEVAESADLRSEYSKEASCENIVGKRRKWETEGGCQIKQASD